jgi:hypothetical protein
MIDRVGKNCAPIQGGKHVLFFRNRDIQFFDYENDIGITRIGSIRPSCWINMIAANGLALIPVGDSGCSCPYPLRTSFAMKHKKDNSFVPWSYYTRTDDSLRPAEHFAINLGAPGDHRDKNGTLWFGYPRPTGTESPRNMIDFELNERVAESMGSFAQDHRFKQIANTKRPWLFASGILGLYSLEIPLSDGQDSEYSVQLGFAALNGDKPGQRVFDIKLQGKLVAENFNISTNGFEDNVTALVKKFNNIKVEKNLVLEFVPKNQNLNMRTAPLLNFIKVSRSN